MHSLRLTTQFGCGSFRAASPPSTALRSGSRGTAQLAVVMPASHPTPTAARGRELTRRCTSGSINEFVRHHRGSSSHANPSLATRHGRRSCRLWLVSNSRARAESLAGTSTTMCSSSARSRWVEGRPGATGSLDCPDSIGQGRHVFPHGGSSARIWSAREGWTSDHEADAACGTVVLVWAGSGRRPGWDAAGHPLLPTRLRWWTSSTRSPGAVRSTAGASSTIRPDQREVQAGGLKWRARAIGSQPEAGPG